MAKKRYKHGTYALKNPGKYVGHSEPVWRSTWEKRVFQWLDSNANITSWASEPIKIPYFNPLTQTVRNYIPDLLIKYIDRHGTEHVKLVEIKPKKETLKESARSKHDQLALAVNLCKWQAAQAWCDTQGISFEVINEDHIFGVK